MYKLIVLAFFAVALNAQNLDFLNGKILAHTEVFGDSNINPFSQNIKSQLTIEKKIDSIKGEIELNTTSLHSSNDKRDEHMYEVLHIKKFPKINYLISEIRKVEDGYEINGILTLNGIKKIVTSKAKIIDENNHIIFDGKFSIKLTSFNIERPTMFFLTVRDQVDITYHLDYIKG
ncbi:hypothetical protein CPU12_08140 [Malaciobacter molluscorum LMG 25693]|uniref:YceI-like domain-containing periplasmic protein n=1 Tax=Malaciobacter molluscorum LMG 25693 TaxID=870501 RepID=A0A2G1DHC9_9BACT|nr:YceI family protein [Malaciobacter molluscorum]AXX93695.1 YceI-like domain-containing periplasmic protein [Malaciobacter molluscorum LMG 25693]PHO17895.1 hypothetical protein CPU12_08140 [Malaciobacter molluscorum LMG 25693]